MGKYTDDDYCDIYEKKICDNCGKCLEEEGIDIRAIKIEDIAKTVEENKVLEEEYKKAFNEENESYEEAEETTEVIDLEEELKEAYKKFNEENAYKLEDEEYEDAFDHIEYFEDVDLFEEGTLEEMTEELFPGVRKLKIKSK